MRSLPAPYDTRFSASADGTIHGARGEKLTGLSTHAEHIQYSIGKRRVLGHQVVWRTFRGPIRRGFVVHHKNHNPADNRLCNLQLLTRAEHARLHARIDPAAVLAAVESGCSWPEAAKTFRCSRRSIAYALKRARVRL